MWAGVMWAEAAEMGCSGVVDDEGRAVGMVMISSCGENHSMIAAENICFHCRHMTT